MDIKVIHPDPVQDHFGVCSACGKNDGFVNIGRGHWFFCKGHRVQWYVGDNLFSSWRQETEEEQRRRYDELGLEDFQIIE